MSSLVFACPNCQQPFQVGESQAGQVVQCPGCAQAVEIPANAFGKKAEPPAPETVEQPLVFSCPTCQGQFGITKEMNGQKVACPHCQAPALIQIGEEPTAESGPVINTKTGISRKRKKSKRKRVKSILPPLESDLSAPSKQPATNPPPVATPKPTTAKPILKSDLSAPTKKLATDPPPPVATDKPISENATSASQPPLRPERRKQDRFKSPPKRKKTNPVPTEPPNAKTPISDGPTVPDSQAGSKPPPVADAPPASDDAPVFEEATEAASEKIEKAYSPNTPIAPAETPPVKATKANVEPEATTEVPPAEKPQLEKPIVEAELESIAHLLPPKFSVFDPNRMRTGMGTEKFKVILPDGKGGTAQLDKRVVRVEHGDQKVSLVVLTEAQRARRRLIQNVIAILIGIGIMALASTLLL